jgi:hypothetical protein
MNLTQLQGLSRRNSGCPSDLLLDRLYAGELLPAATQELLAHIEGCPTCPGRMAVRAAGFAAFVEVDPRQLLAGVRRRLATAPPQSVSWRLGSVLSRRLGPLFAATAAMALLAVVLIGRSLSPAPGGAGPAADADTTRQKGGLGLHVYRLSGGQATEAQSGDSFPSGDRLRFAVDLPRAGQVSILGIDGAGQLYSAWPTAGGPLTSRPLSAGAGQQLPGAVALDGSPGPERLYLVLCPSPGPPPSCQSAGATVPPSCSADCRLVGFVVGKGR